MQIKSVARKDLIPFAEKAFFVYKLSAEQMRDAVSKAVPFSVDIWNRMMYVNILPM